LRLSRRCEAKRETNQQKPEQLHHDALP